MTRIYPEIWPHRVVSLGAAWAGNAVNAQPYRCQGLVSRAGVQIGAFYDAEGDVVVFRRRSGAPSLMEMLRLAVEDKPFDAHYSISLGLDRHDRIHLVFGAHSSAPNYVRSRSDSLGEGFERMKQISGQQEGRFTYPMFFDDPLTGDLAMLYRNGHSSDGSIRVKRFHSDSKTWTDDLKPLITGSGGPDMHHGPYVNTPILGRDAMNYLFLLWRLAPNEAGGGLTVNDGIDLVASRDGWRSLAAIDGTLLSRPASPLTVPRVWAIPRDSATINQSGAAEDANGFPAGIFWWRDESGIPQINILRFEANEWRAHRASDFTTPFDLDGAATLRLPHSRPALVSHPSGAFICLFRTVEQGGGLVAHVLYPPNYDLASMARVGLVSGDLGGYQPVFDASAPAEGRLSMYLQRCEFAEDGTMPGVAEAGAAWLADWSLDAIVSAAMDRYQTRPSLPETRAESDPVRPRPLPDAAPTQASSREIRSSRQRPLSRIMAAASNLSRRMTFFRNRERRELAMRGRFDPDWYRVRHPDVAAAGVDPLTHYLIHGKAEARAARFVRPSLPDRQERAEAAIPRAGLGGRIAVYTAISDDMTACDFPSCRKPASTTSASPIGLDRAAACSRSRPWTISSTIPLEPLAT